MVSFDSERLRYKPYLFVKVVYSQHFFAMFIVLCIFAMTKVRPKNFCSDTFNKISDIQTGVQERIKGESS